MGGGLFRNNEDGTVVAVNAHGVLVWIVHEEKGVLVREGFVTPKAFMLGRAKIAVGRVMD